MNDTPGDASPAQDTITRLQASVAPALAMLAGMQLEIFTHLAERPRSAADLAITLDVEADRLSRLLHALVVSGLLEKRQDGFANKNEAAAFLVKGRVGYLGGVHELLSQIWHADLLTAQSIRTGAPAALHDFNATSDQEMAAMLRGMHGGAAAAGRDFARRFDFSGCRSIIDIGGGSGGLLAALCEAHPGLHGTLFELPRTAPLAAAILRDSPGGERVSIEAGDILMTPPRQLHDAVVMRALLQVLSRTDAARAVANAAAVVRPGGSIYIAGGGILDDDRLGPAAAVFWSVTFMNLYPSGESYTETEHVEWLEAAGCGEVERITLPTGGGIIRATKRQ
jgi:SAM-dependent methyltransferase